MASRWSLGSVLWLEIHQPGEGHAAHKTRVRFTSENTRLGLSQSRRSVTKGPLSEARCGIEIWGPA